jgi:hypothetical protein
VAAVRAAYVADVSELAYSRRGPDGEWGLPLGPRATEAIIDLVGLSFVPLYRFLGPVSMIVILVLFFVGISRLVFTILFRAIVLGRTRGCGFWIFAAFLGCAYQLLISLIQRADRKAQEIAARVESGMLNGAEDEAKSAKEFPAILSNYPSLTEVRQNERYNFWRSLCKREAGVDEEVAASVPERGQEGEWQPLSNEVNGLPKIF